MKLYKLQVSDLSPYTETCPPYSVYHVHGSSPRHDRSNSARSPPGAHTQVHTATSVFHMWNSTPQDGIFDLGLPFF